METYRLHDDVKEWAYTPLAVGTPFDLVTAQVATLALFNKTGSGKRVRVRQVKAEILQAQTTVTAVPTNFELRRITAHTASDEVIPAIKIDANNATLPSQVVLCRRPSSITTTGSVIETVPTLPLANVTRALGGLCSRSMHTNLTDNFWRWEWNGDVQRIVLREGEGLALDPAGIHNAHPHWLEAGVNVRVVATGACYRYKFPIYTSPFTAWSLLNGSGSGVVLEVFRLTLRELGTDETPQVTLELIDSIDETSGYACVPDPFDTANSLAAGIVGRGNVKVTLAGGKMGGLTGAPHLFTRAGFSLGVGPALAGIAPQMQGHLWSSQPYLSRATPDGCCDIVLNEGEGLALFQRTASGLTYFDLYAQFTVEGVTGGYPPVNKVQLGYDYGPNLEYEGTLAGGGGNTYPRSRVVNQ